MAMKRLFVITALVAALATSAVALGAGTPKITEKVLGAAGVSQGYTFHIAKPGDIVVAKAIVPPGASFGWHSHRAAVAVVVRTGTLTLYDSADPSCHAQRYSAGQGFVEHRHHVHLARNEGTKKVVVLVTYLGLKHGVNPDVPAKSPGNCPF
jgi:quercetin dioxygenase-like cupin family protein